MDRRIICYRIPSFEIALARLGDPSLAARPVAIAAPHHPRAILREVSREAQEEGLSVGMTVEDARWLCPSLCLVPPSPSRLREGQHALQEVIRQFAPVWEPAAPGYVFLDITGTHRLFGPAADAGMRIQREIRARHGLAGASGVGTNKLVTDVAATLLDPGQVCDVWPGEEHAFMAPLPASALPELSAPSSRTVVTLLDDLNLCTLGAIADVPPSQLRLVVGDQAEELSRRARGIDATPVFPVAQHPRLREELSLEPDAIDTDRLRAALPTLVGRLCRTLRQQRRTCRVLRLTIVHSDQVEISREAAPAVATCWESDLSSRAENLLLRCLRRRVRVRTIMLEAGWLQPVVHQLCLFGDSSKDARADRLALALDRVRARYSEHAIRRGCAV